MRPDESLFKKHLEEAVFLNGVEEGLWGTENPTEDIVWPYAILWCKATAPEGDGYSKYYFRFNLENYSNAAPTAIPWDVLKKQRLPADVWPRWSEQLQKVFNPQWQNGVSLYAPCDRLAMPGHAQWQVDHSAYWWTPDSTIVKYLRFLVKILNNNEY